MRSKRRHELETILQAATRGTAEELASIVANLKSETNGKLRLRASSRRAREVEQALAAVTAGAASARSISDLAIRTRTIIRHTCGGTL
jgi:hypothetical protein